MQNKAAGSIRVFPPGDTLRETLEAMGMSQAELAARMGVTERHVCSVVKGESPIAEDTALRLERVLGIDAVFWRNLEQLYCQHLAERREGKLPSRAPGDGAAQGKG